MGEYKVNIQAVFFQQQVKMMWVEPKTKISSFWMQYYFALIFLFFYLNNVDWRCKTEILTD